jgi:hypothetical protein
LVLLRWVFYGCMSYKLTRKLSVSFIVFSLRRFSNSTLFFWTNGLEINNISFIMIIALTSIIALLTMRL